MSTIVTRSGKGSPLTHTEVDNNFTNLNTDKLQSGDTASSLTITSADINGGTIDGATIGASTASSGVFTSLSDSGNLTFTGTGNRITGDFSNATATNRVAFQTSTTNGNTVVGAIPNGTSVTSVFRAFNNSDTTNAGQATIGINNTDMFLNASALGSGTNLPMTFFTGGSERLRIGTSGNVGIGISSPSTKLQVVNTGSTDTRISLGNANAGFQMGIEASGLCLLANFVDQPIYFATNGSERMRIDSSGNVGIGTNSPRSPGGGFQGLTLNGSTSGFLDINTNGTRVMTLFGSGNDAVIAAGVSSGVIGFTTNSTERMRIDSSGNLIVGTTSPQATGTFVRTTSGDTIAAQNTNNGAHANFVSRRAGTSGFAIYFDCASNQAGTISHPTTTTTVYGTTSDYRLKTVIGNITGSGQRIDALKPIEYEWKEGGRTKGFLAHQFAEVYPNSVSGDKDAVNEEGKPVYQSMQASTPEVMADLIAEIQSLRKRVALLESK